MSGVPMRSPKHGRAMGWAACLQGSNEMASGIGREMAKGAAWMVGMRLAVRGIGLISTVILARLLRPEDFGLVALASAFVGMIDVLSNFSFDIALIREGQAGRSHYDTVFTLSIVRGVLMALGLAIFAEPAGEFFHDSRVAFIVYFFAAGTVLESLQNVGIVNFRKDMTFGLEFAFTTATKLVSFVVTITVALVWRQYWALVAGILAGKLAGLALSYALHPYRPRLSLKEWRELFHFSKWLLVTNLALFLSNRLDAFIIGRMSGPRVLGLYDISLEIVSLPTAELVAPIQRALYPGYAKIAGNTSDLAKYFLSIFAVIFAFALPAGLGIALLATPIVRLFLGSAWLDSVPLIQVLAFMGIFYIGASNSTSILWALGKSRAVSFITIAKLACLGPLLVAGISYGGAKGAAYAVVAAALVNLVLAVGATLRALSLSLGALLRSSWRTVLAGGFMTVVVQLLVMQWPSAETSPALIAEVAGVVTLGALAYAAAHFLIWRLVNSPNGPERDVLALAEAVLARWQRRKARQAEG
jgi:PST family polysaccharide transporter